MNGALNRLQRAVSKNTVSLTGFTGSRVDRRPIRLKKYTEARIPGYVDVASQGTDAEIEFPSYDLCFIT